MRKLVIGLAAFLPAIAAQVGLSEAKVCEVVGKVAWQSKNWRRQIDYSNPFRPVPRGLRIHVSNGPLEKNVHGEPVYRVTDYPNAYISADEGAVSCYYSAD